MSRKSLTAHFGIASRDVTSVCGAIKRRRDIGVPHIEGDGWNSWGESVGTDVNDGDTAHIYAHVASVMEFMALCVLLQHYLVMSNTGVWAVLTDRQLWEQDWIIVHDLGTILAPAAI